MKTLEQKIISAWTKSNALYTQAAAILGVSYPELMVLYALQTMGSLTQKQISESFALQKQTVNTVVKALVQREVLKLAASQTDKREKILLLTAKGQVYAQKIVLPLLQAESRISQSIGAEKLQVMCDVYELFNILLEKELHEGLKYEL